jgi:hypothetical protein
MTPQSCLGTGWKAKPNEVSNSDTLSPAGYLHVLCDCQLLGLLEVFKLIGAYDVIVTFGVPFVMVIEGGAVTVQPKIVWNGVAANAFLLLWIAGVVAWLWHKIASRLASSKLRIIKTVSTGRLRSEARRANLSCATRDWCDRAMLPFATRDCLLQVSTGRYLRPSIKASWFLTCLCGTSP